MTNRVLITGVHGFCAGHLVRRLMAEGVVHIFGVDIHPAPPEKLDLRGYSRLDITIQSQVDDTIQAVKPDVVFHLAGITRGTAVQVYHVNFLGSVYLLEAVHRVVPGARVLLVGSAAEHGHVPEGEMPVRETYPCNPFTPYGISKYSMTLAAMGYGRDHGVKVIVARPFNIVGPGMPATLVVGAVLERIRKALKERPGPVVVSVGNLETERDFIAVDDVVDAYITMARSACWGEVFNICSGVPRSVRSVLEELVSFSTQRIRLQTEPGLQRPTDVPVMYGSWEKAHKAFGFKPRKSLTESLREAWESSV